MQIDINTLKSANLQVNPGVQRPGYYGRMPLRLLLMMILLLFPLLLLGVEYETYKVKPGDTLTSIAKKTGISITDLKKRNNLKSDIIKPGQVLKTKEKPKPKPKPKPTTPKPSTTPATTATTPAQTPATPAPTTPTPATPVKPIESVESVPEQPTQAAPGPVDYTKIKLPDEYYYTVKAGDNPYRIYSNAGIQRDDFLRWNNRETLESFTIHPGDRVIIRNPVPYVQILVAEPPTVSAEQPRKPAVAPSDSVVIQQTYTVQKGDNLYRISLKFNTTVEDLKVRNHLDSNDIKVGQVLYVAGTAPAGTKRPVAPPLTEADIAAKDRIRTDLVMPVEGQVTSEFGVRNGRPHKGIDIGAKIGTPVYAVLDGVVVFSGVQSGYGNVVVLEHPDFVMTVYAHNDKNLVQVNDVVKKGQVIAHLGNTGNSSGPHLHFEYRIKGTAINPRKVLPF